MFGVSLLAADSIVDELIEFVYGNVFGKVLPSNYYAWVVLFLHKSILE